MPTRSTDSTGPKDQTTSSPNYVCCCWRQVFLCSPEAHCVDQASAPACSGQRRAPPHQTFIFSRIGLLRPVPPTHSPSGPWRAAACSAVLPWRSWWAGSAPRRSSRHRAGVSWRAQALCRGGGCPASTSRPGCRWRRAWARTSRPADKYRRKRRSRRCRREAEAMELLG